MYKILTLLLISAFGVNSLADIAKNLRGQSPENKLIIQSCEVNYAGKTSCSVVSDVNLSSVIKGFNKISGNPYIYSPETLDVQKGSLPDGTANPGVFPYWETCDAEDGDCLEWNVGTFSNFINNYFFITAAQKNAVLNKIRENSVNQNTTVYFLKRDAKIRERNDDGTMTYYDLKDARLTVN